jgi:hypothetical protein
VSVAQTDDRVHLVGLDGCTLPCTERAYFPEPSSEDPAAWSNYWDVWRYELGPEPEINTDIIRNDSAPDGPDDPRVPSYGQQCHDLIVHGVARISGGAPEPTREDISDLETWLDQVDADGYPPANQISPDELSMLAAGLPVG